MKVRPKKSLGQHFLINQDIALRIVNALKANNGSRVLEIGPGTGILTRYLRNKQLNLKLIELDRDSVAYLNQEFPQIRDSIIEGDFLKADFHSFFDSNFRIIGNLPYNISSQIFFKILANRSMIDEVVCMIQKEVAQRISSPPGSKVYGILSVLLQAFYIVEYLFTVKPGSFHPPPKVDSAVIRLTRNETKVLDCNEDLFFRIVKQGFQNRRKTLRNALKPINLPDSIKGDPLFDKRAEALGVSDFVELTNKIERSWNQ